MKNDVANEIDTADPAAIRDEKANLLDDEARMAYTCDSCPAFDEVAGLLVDEFTPAGYELQLLAQHYLNEVFYYRYLREFSGQFGSAEMQSDSFARLRLETIVDVLGEELAERTLRPVGERWAKAFERARDNQQHRQNLLEDDECLP